MGEKHYAERKVTLSFRVNESFANAVRSEAAKLGITVSDLLGRKLGIEPLRAAITSAKEAAKDHVSAREYVEAELKRKPIVREVNGDPVVTAKYMYDQYMSEAEIPSQFATAHSAGIIPLSWFTARYGYPDASHIDAFEEFLSVDDPSDFGLNEPCWEFVEE